MEAERLRMDLVERDPLTGGGIIGSMQHGGVFYLALKEEVEGGNIETTIQIMVGIREEIGGGCDVQTCLFFYFPDDALFYGFIDICESPGEVERSLGRLTITHRHQQFATTITDEGHHGGRGIEEHLMTALAAFLALFGADEEISTATNRTMLIMVQGMLFRFVHSDGDYQLSVRNGNKGRPAAFFRLPIWKFLKQ